MRARPLAPAVWLAAGGLSLVLAGCGLTLDYGPPDSVLDSGHASDGGGIDAAMACTGACDDGLRCTSDACVDGFCVFTNACPGETECVDRGGDGECRRPCASASECDDGIDCTTDVCDPADAHCAHVSTCQTGRPVCLASGACAPASCASDTECDDGNLCNGVERCVSGECRAGTRVVCEGGSGCVGERCNPSSGACEPVLDDSACADGFDCTGDVCNADGSCSNPQNNAACSGTNLCATSICHPPTSLDSSGCVDTIITACPDACGVSVACDPATGGCDFGSVCPAGEVCRSDGCQPIGNCTNDAECADVFGPGGCATFCAGGTCQPLACVAPAGSCGVPVLDGSCFAGTHCSFTASPALCDDGDDRSTDTCNPDTLTCSHTCPPASSTDCVTYTYSGGRCVPTLDSSICARRHTTTLGDCARWTCVGHDAAAGGGTDGCAPLPSNAACAADSASCTDEICVLDGSTRMGTCHSQISPLAGSICDDGMDCTVDACDPVHAPTDATGCTHTPDDGVCASAAGSLECATAFCAQTGTLANSLGGTPLPTGCAVDYHPVMCGLLDPSICTLDGQCEVVSCSLGMRVCDDRNSCNGTESCDVVLGHCTQLPLATTCLGTGGCGGACTSTGCVLPIIPACIGIGTTP